MEHEEKANFVVEHEEKANFDSGALEIVEWVRGHSQITYRN